MVRVGRWMGGWAGGWGHWKSCAMVRVDEWVEEQEELQHWLPAEDYLQLAAVELAPVGQSHDALLVALQVLGVHLL